MLVVQKSIKETAKDYNVAADFCEALSAAVEQTVLKACERAKANNRKTITPKDI